ncbi:hypothetical protein [Actinoalloteichus hymeniacidonis]|uniref:hypothetical protein n=1 Tax=Actinoalloteichus hymeniacidonis TaxID=340345 RepID=UPI001560DD9D|nr:hypothetical protein [Actinoalloteichus hymeniacidonis]
MRPLLLWWLMLLPLLRRRLLKVLLRVPLLALLSRTRSLCRRRRGAHRIRRPAAF